MTTQKEEISLFWMRRDLRLEDNSALFHALKNEKNVLLLFIFDKNILDKLENKSDKRVSFIYKTISNIKSKLESFNSSMLVFNDEPIHVFENILKQYELVSLYFNHDYEPYALERDKQIGNLLETREIPVNSFKDQVIFEKNEVVKNDKKPYHVFTPYSRKWKEEYNSGCIHNYNSENYFDSLFKTEPFRMPDIEEMGFHLQDFDFPSSKINTDKISEYDKTRNIPSVDGTSRLGIHLRFGTISIRKLVEMASETNETFLNELIWREFFMVILWFYPETTDKSFKPLYDNIQWDNDEKMFKAWCEGKTGYPIADAGMRQLNQTGFMHNRVRMITASLLVKHLLVDWRWGEAYFAEKLLDYEQSSNVGNWQWVAGSGCDAAPYFRIFNPYSQAKRFDHEEKYIRKWIPELGTEQYPDPVVEHKYARERALRAYKSALNQRNEI